MNTAHIKTGHDGCIAWFQPALYQLTLLTNDPHSSEYPPQRIELGYSGSRLLERLLRTPGKVISREELIAHTWADRVVGPGSLNQQIHTLRQILGDEKHRKIIQTLPRRGYQLNPDFLLFVPALDELTDTQPQGHPADSPEPEAERPPAVRRTRLKGLRLYIALAGGACIGGSVGVPAEGPPLSNERLIERGEQRPRYRQMITHTNRLTDNLEAFADHPVKLMVVRLPNGDYEVCCLRKNGDWWPLEFYGDSRQSVDDQQLEACLK